MSEERKPVPGDDKAATESSSASEEEAARPQEHGGPKGPEPTRYGDWEKNGRCYDF